MCHVCWKKSRLDPFFTYKRAVVSGGRRIFSASSHFLSVFAFVKTQKLFEGFPPMLHEKKTISAAISLSPYPNHPFLLPILAPDGFQPSVNNIFCSGNARRGLFRIVFHIYVSTATQTNFIFNSNVYNFSSIRFSISTTATFAFKAVRHRVKSLPDSAACIYIKLFPSHVMSVEC